jgi:hypothetical protein
MMNHKTPIRVIKHGRRQSDSRLAEPPANESKNLRQNAREVAGNVAAWVREFKTQRPADPRQAFANLFVDAPSSLKSLT